ncbi:hypothetical protein MSAN_01160900 [Mycena sanguinolenta]|uniref:RING-type domain-containing protein n=1 Tax=Mycena sanguinolenta TaxID=230812 RepID=A0A8H7D3X6_9AGAR|nr:hypothetical protein MSAN_01160900 [Mycena sanguinolenta]
MGQAASASRQRAQAQESAAEEEGQQAQQERRTRRRSVRNSLRGLVKSKRRHSIASTGINDSPDSGSRRASRRWSRALSLRPSSPPPAPQEAQSVVDNPELEPEAEVEEPEQFEEEENLSDVEELLEPPPRVRPPTPMPHRSPTPPPPPPPAPPIQHPQPHRTFPPPGTLVVVQGVVHTTDVPPASTDNNNNTPGGASANATISSSSIDVLGTLLTVAAQATAASLLTGSSDALLGRAHPAHPSQTNSTQPNQDNTTSPSASDSAAETLTPLPTSQIGPPSSPRRNPWSTLRERLGPAFPPPSHLPSSSPLFSSYISYVSTDLSPTPCLPLHKHLAPCLIRLHTHLPLHPYTRRQHIPHLRMRPQGDQRRACPPAERPRGTSARRCLPRWHVRLIWGSDSGRGGAGAGRVGRGAPRRTYSTPGTASGRERVGAGRRTLTAPVWGGAGLDGHGETERASERNDQVANGDSAADRAQDGAREGQQQSGEGAQTREVGQDPEEYGDEEEEGEGTFERFLVDLQAELRVALGARPAAAESAVPAATTEGEPQAEGEAEGQDEGEEDEDVEDEDEDADTDADTKGAQKEDQGDANAHASTSASSPYEPRSDVQEPAPPETTLPQPTVITTQSTPTAAAPASTSTGTAPTPPTPSPTPGTVNWWRLYRFPPVVTSGRGGMSAAVPTPGPAAPSSSEEGACPGFPILRRGEPSSPQTPAPASASLPSPSSPSPAPPHAPGQTVVPVIVVGLQSVALGTAMGMGLFGGGLGHPPHAPPAQHVPPGQPHESPSVDIEVGATEEGAGAEPGTRDVGTQTPTHLDTNAGSFGSETPDSERRARRRSWWRPSVIGGPLRGVRAIGVGMGMGETVGGRWSVDAGFCGRGSTGRERARDASAAPGGGANATGNVPTSGPGGPSMSPVAGTDTSRTFLIYVIGGYYPPEHGILNGAGGAESLEALFRELPELLGYAARPPTASKADIARAGLAVISPAALPDAERAGRVLSTCVERCLICLDEYDETDEIRILSCRHAFHIGCVDRWLEEGRNNCPACRTKGVSTDPVAPASAAAHA